MIHGISQWYTTVGDHTFPTVFIGLHEEEKQLIISGDASAEVISKLIGRIDQAIASLPGACFVGVDTCAPDDSSSFKRRKSHSSGKTALELLKSSDKVTEALKSGKSDRLIVRPYRRMDKTREFRLFIHEKELKGMSQRNLERHFRRLDVKREEYWTKANEFVQEILPFLDCTEAVIDIYFTSQNQVLIVDFNEWGECSPLLFRKWDRDWNEISGLKLMAEPIKMQGDVKVSF
jgi:hypothetical protein